MSTRKLIYVPSEEIWESVKKAAIEDGRSASNYLIQLHRVNIGIACPAGGVLSGIQEEEDL